MHWIERRNAITRVAEELQRRGWTLFGYHPGESRPWEDYFQQASWDAVATHPEHPGVVICVDVSPHTIERCSGKEGWPEFQLTPERRAWHVKKGSQVVATGVGLSACSGWGDSWRAGVKRFVDRIEAEIQKATSNDTSWKKGNSYTVQYEGDCTWIPFETRPSEAVREALKRDFSARFSGRRMAWYVPRRVDVSQIERAILSA